MAFFFVPLSQIWSLEDKTTLKALSKALLFVLLKLSNREMNSAALAATVNSKSNLIFGTYKHKELSPYFLIISTFNLHFGISHFFLAVKAMNFHSRGVFEHLAAKIAGDHRGTWVWGAHVEVLACFR
jgi:hypothetical protein